MQSQPAVALAIQPNRIGATTSFIDVAVEQYFAFSGKGVTWCTFCKIKTYR